MNTRSPEENRKRVKIINDPYEACKDTHAIAILTEWDEFKEYEWERIFESVVKPAFVFDGRKLLDSESMTKLGFKYSAIGVANKDAL